MEYYLKTDDEKYLIELDIEGKNLIVSKLDCVYEDGKEYSTIFELRNTTFDIFENENEFTR